MTIKLRRIDVCDLLLACTYASHSACAGEKWIKLHDMLKDQLEEFDAKHDEHRKGAN